MTIRITRVYTGTGDNGTTTLVGGVRVQKTDLVIEAYGTADELNSALGIVRTFAEQPDLQRIAFFRESAADLRRLQNKLFDLSSRFTSSPEVIPAGMPTVTPADVAWLEGRIDSTNEPLPILRSFVIPGGCHINAHAHMARAVCRRLERTLWRLQETGTSLEEVSLTFINRLSDYLFVLARRASFELDQPEFLWAMESD